MRRLSLLLLVTLAGCAAQPRAFINDVSLPKALQNEYRVVAVDGTAVQRAENAAMTLVPFVVAPAGKHTFTIKSQETGATSEIKQTVEAGMSYRIVADKEGGLKLVEYVSGPPAAEPPKKKRTNPFGAF